MREHYGIALYVIKRIYIDTVIWLTVSILTTKILTGYSFDAGCLSKIKNL